MNQTKPEQRNASVAVMAVVKKAEDILVLLETIKLIKKKNFEVFLINDGIDEAGMSGASDQLNSFSCKIAYNSAASLSLHDKLMKSLTQAASEQVMIIDCHALTKPANLNEFFNAKQQSNTVYAAAFKKKDKEIRDEAVLMMPYDIVTYICSNFLTGNSDITLAADYFIKKNEISVTPLFIGNDNPFRTKSILTYITGLFHTVVHSFNWHLRTPLKDLTSRIDSGFAQHSMYRFLFTVAIVALLPVMMMMSRTAGISGDENVNYTHAGYVYNYYKTMGEDTAALNTPKTMLQHYGQSFDNFTYYFNTVFNIENVYESRHIMNSITGWLAILITGIFAAYVAGWRAGFIAIILMFFSPVFLGHSFNNPKDVPFAMAYILTVYAIAKNMRHLQRPNKHLYAFLAISIGLAISVRIGGLLLVAFLFMFTGMKYLANRTTPVFSSKFMKGLFNAFMLMAVISGIGYLIGILYWPFALKDPIHNPLQSLGIMTNFTASLRQLFEGKIVWSDAIPWYYAPKYILISVPVIIILGLLLICIFIFNSRYKAHRFDLFMLLFVFIFPVVYLIYKNSNLYGGWRHVLFVFPPMVILAATGFDAVLSVAKNKYFQIAVACIMALLLIHPAKHIIKNHPHEYIYYNQLAGGVEGAFGKYEMDYYYHSLRAGSQWIIDSVLDERGNDTSKLIVAGNASLEYYFRNFKDKVKPVYVRYYDRGNSDWDYAVIACSYINPYHLTHKMWPPAGTVHVVKVDDVPVCAVIKRISKADLLGSQEMQKGDLLQARIHLEQAVKEDSVNVAAMINLAKVYAMFKDYNTAVNMCYQCLHVYPDYDNMLFTLGLIYINQGEQQRTEKQPSRQAFENALASLNRATIVNTKLAAAYHYMGVAFANLMDFQAALDNFNKALQQNPRNRESYLWAAEMLKRLGRQEDARAYMNAAYSMQ